MGDQTPYDPTSLAGVPASARERLGQNREGLFTSDLSVSEFLLITHAGFAIRRTSTTPSRGHAGRARSRTACRFRGARAGCAPGSASPPG